MRHLLSLRYLAYKLFPQRLHSVLHRIEASDIGSRLARGVFWTAVGTLISRGLMLCATILVARMLGKTEYGQLGMIQSTVSMFIIFAGFGLGLTATKHVAEFRQRDPERAGRIIAISGVIATITGSLAALGLMLVAPWLAEKVINAQNLTNVLRVSAIMLFFSALNGAQLGALSGFEAFKTIALVNLLAGLISFPLLVGGAYFGGLLGAVWALCIYHALNWLFHHVALRREIVRHEVSIHLGGWRSELSILKNYSLPAAMSGAIVVPAIWASRALLANEADGYEELGVFSAAIVFQVLIMAVSGMLSRPLLSMLSNESDKTEGKLGLINMLSSWSIGVLCSIPLLCFPEIAEAMFGKDYEGYNFRLTLTIVLLYTSIMTYKEGLARILAAKKLLWWALMSNFLWVFVLLSTALCFSHAGASGLAASFFIAYTINTLAIFPIYYRRNLVPRQMLISRNSAIVWATLVILGTLNFYEAPLALRILSFVVSLAVVGFAFNQIMRNDGKKQIYRN